MRICDMDLVLKRIVLLLIGVILSIMVSAAFLIPEKQLFMQRNVSLQERKRDCMSMKSIADDSLWMKLKEDDYDQY